jgi:hypothetical protein
MREITVFLTATDENLRNLNNNSEIFKLPLNVDGDIDKVSMSASIEMFKIDPVDTGTNAGEYAGLAGNIIFILVGLVILVAVLLATFRIIRSASSPLEEISTFDDYEYTQGNPSIHLVYQLLLNYLRKIRWQIQCTAVQKKYSNNLRHQW